MLTIDRQAVQYLVADTQQSSAHAAHFTSAVYNCWRRSSCATSGPAALTRNAALPSGHPRTPHLELSL